MKLKAKGYGGTSPKEQKELKAKLKIIKAKMDKNVYCEKCNNSIIGDKYRCLDKNLILIKDKFLCDNCYINVLPF